MMDGLRNVVLSEAPWEASASSGNLWMLLQRTTFTADWPALEIAGHGAAAKEAVDGRESWRRAGVNY
eukprot:812650-Rhodomonas_salina.1